MNLIDAHSDHKSPLPLAIPLSLLAATVAVCVSPQAAVANPSANSSDDSSANPSANPDTETPEQEKLRNYLQQLLDNEISDNETSAEDPAFPSLGSTVFDAQLAGYISYIETVGVPDILIVGSSRALQGIDPEVLQTRLATQGYDGLKVYNFSVNGATAQVVDFILGELLPGPLPAVVVWGDGSRAFNDGRRDRTWETLTSSPGYQAIASGRKPTAPNLVETESAAQNAELVTALSTRTVSNGTTSNGTAAGSAAGTLDGLGFSAIGDRFDPAAYYRQFPRVSGRYDGAYSPFTLEGHQTVALAQVTETLQQQNSRLIFVNLPLSSSYLDEFRLYHEGQFQMFLQAQSQARGFAVVDLLTQWDGQPGFFADPSHINQHGAAAIADQLARDPELLFALTTPSEGHENTANEAKPWVAPSLDSLLNGVNSQR